MRREMRIVMVIAMVGAALALGGCLKPEQPAAPGGEPAKVEAPSSAAAPEAGSTSQPAADLPAAGHYGGAFSMSESAPLAAVLDQAATHDGKTVRVKGQVASVCKKKGCWFVLKTDEEKTRTVRITMKDYGFFVPKDCDGKAAEVEGVLQRKVVPEAMRKHLAEDNGEDPSKVSGDAEEIQLVATAVDIAG